jgi:hypothetical protein
LNINSFRLEEALQANQEEQEDQQDQQTLGKED